MPYFKPRTPPDVFRTDVPQLRLIAEAKPSRS